MHINSIRFQAPKFLDKKLKGHQFQDLQSMVQVIFQALLCARRATTTCLGGSILVLMGKSDLTTTKREKK